MKNVVFLTCTPEMWEGFETLYVDHVNDPECNVAVVPMPLYNKDAQGNPSAPMYETSGYPDYVPITYFNSYDFEHIHPDTIYIQNAQDNCNPCVSVHPFFYTSNLKNITSDLVYIPYNVFPESDLDSLEKLEALRPLLIPDNIENVDHIILQSKNMKNAYLDLICGANSIKRGIWENKISFDNYPRTDILKRLKPEDFLLPDEWRSFLYDQSGNRRTTVLYCNSIFALLTENRAQLKKIRNTLEFFKTCTSTTALIWRPNPQTDEVLNRLRPCLYAEYKELVGWYQKENFGIFDDSITPTTAIVLSDGFFGDSCGAMELFKSTGKPVMQENVEIMYDSKLNTHT